MTVWIVRYSDPWQYQGLADVADVCATEDAAERVRAARAAEAEANGDTYAFFVTEHDVLVS